MNQLIIPINGINTTIESEHSFVIVGANGSGKSHLGAYIESKNTNNTLRISAQRALSIPDIIAVKGEESAFNKVHYGNEKEHNNNYKWNWGKSTTTLVDDYGSVLAAVFARITNEQKQYFDACRRSEKENVEKPKTPQIISDKIIDIWKTVFPHRNIIIGDNKVVAANGESTYHAQDMSDGERVAIYLMGQCLVAPDNMTLIIDEPEIHLHKSIMQKLWDKIEEYCPNKTFVYITHDLDFAVSRKEAKKIWVKKFYKEKGQERWDIELLNDNNTIPDSLLLEVLGNRKDVLFVEGEKGSYDSQLYSAVYEDYYVIPCHNCYKVIEFTKAFNDSKMRTLHNINVKGIIDRDYMSEEEITAYNKDNIFTLNVSEVENLFLLEEIQHIIAEHQALDNIQQTINTIKEFVFSEFQNEKDIQVLSKYQRELSYKFQQAINEKVDTKDAIEKNIRSIDYDGLYSDVLLKTEKILQDKDYNALLKIYNRKGLLRQISKFFKVTDYPDLVLRLLKTDKKKEIVDALKQHLPNISKDTEPHQ